MLTCFVIVVLGCLHTYLSLVGGLYNASFFPFLIEAVDYTRFYELWVVVWEMGTM